MTAASALRRKLPKDHEVVVLERGSWTSYSACGIPYWISGEVGSAEALVARSVEAHLANGIDVRMGVEATAIDPAARTVSIRGGGRPLVRPAGHRDRRRAGAARPPRHRRRRHPRRADPRRRQALIDGLAEKPEHGRGRRLRLRRPRDRRGLRGARLRHDRHRPVEGAAVDHRARARRAGRGRDAGARHPAAVRHVGHGIHARRLRSRQRGDDRGRLGRRGPRRPRARRHARGPHWRPRPVCRSAPRAASSSTSTSAVVGHDDIWAAGDCVVDQGPGDRRPDPRAARHARQQAGPGRRRQHRRRRAGIGRRGSASRASYVRRSPSSARWRSRARGWGSGRRPPPGSTRSR